MVRFKKILLFNLFFFLAVFTHGQQNNAAPLVQKYRALHWNSENGLAFDKTYCMLKDIRGFLWIGTEDGLSRFDGSIFKNYFYEPGKSRALGGSLIRGLVEDSLHNIWIGTDRGLSRYDMMADTFSNFLPDYKSTGFASFIVPFWATKNEIYCQESDSVICSYNIRSFKKSILVHLGPGDRVGLGYSVMHSVFDEASGSVWMSEACNDSSRGVLLQIELSTGKRTHYNWPCFKKIPNHCHFFESLCYDHKRNALWFSTDDGLINFSLVNKIFSHDEELIKIERLKNYGSFVGISIDPGGTIWFCPRPQGISYYDPDTRSVREVFPANPARQGQISEANGVLYCDRDGMVWSGYWLRRGIYQIAPVSAPVTRYLADTVGNHPWRNIIFNCVKGGQGKLWMGTDEDGIIIYDTKSSGFTKIPPNEIPGVKQNFPVTPLFVDTNTQKALIMVRKEKDEIFLMHAESKKFDKVIFKGSAGQTIYPEKIYYYCPFGNTCLVSEGHGEQGGIYSMNMDSGIAHLLLAFPRNSIDGSFYASPEDHLLFVKRAEILGNLTYSFSNNRWSRVTNPLDSIHWNLITQSKADSSYWVTAPKALIHFSKDFHQIRRYGNEEGLPGNKIFMIIPDKKGNIWFNTNQTIYQLNTKTGNITGLSEKDGFEIQDFRELGSSVAGILNDDGDLYFPGGGTAQGFQVVKPAKYITTPSTVYLKSVEIKQFVLPISTGINNIEELSLKYFQNRIVIETGTIDYYSAGKGYIRYKLEGEDMEEKWQISPANSTIRYEELPPGKYKLLIQAGNAGHEFTGPMRSLIFQISPAFWDTWWFRIIAGLLLVGGIYAAIRYRLHQKFRLRLESSEKEKQLADMRQSTAELKQQTTELEMQALRAQMNPHFIFNSLNSINRFILQNNRLQASEYLTKFSRLIRLILMNSQTALINLESEIESVKLYLSLESLRFDYHFEYKLSVHPDLDISVLKVPSLIIQPYIENAIWHGLMHKKEKGQLDIELSQEEDHLYFKITDNGIGRRHSAALASKSATLHKSMGLGITARRIAMLQSGNYEGSSVVINDLVNEDGSAAGTEVIIKIPVIQ